MKRVPAAVIVRQAFKFAVMVLCLLIFLSPSARAATTFNFTLNAPYVTTAGAYNSAGQLVRTIWRRVSYSAGPHSGTWDDTDDSGVLAPAGTYTIKVLFHNVHQAWDGTIGSTSSSFVGVNLWRSFNSMFNLAISGTNAFVAFGSNEGNTDAARFSTANPQSMVSIGPVDGSAIFQYVATDGARAYYADAGAANRQNTFTIAYNVADNSVYTFAGGSGLWIPGDTNYYPSCIDVDYDPTASGVNQPTGIAVQQAGTVLAVAHGPRNLIRLFDKVRGGPILDGSGNPETITVASPQALAFAPNGDLWVITGTSTQYSSGSWAFTGLNVERFDGATLGTTNTPAATISGLSDPLSISVDPTTSNVLVADGGTNQQVFGYSSAGALQWTYGVQGGYAAGTLAADGVSYIPTNGIAVANNKFLFRNIVNWVGPMTAVAAAPDGSFWISDPSTCRMLHISSNLTYIEDIEYIPENYTCSVDPGNPSRVIGGTFLEFNVDYTKPLSPTNGPWTLVNNWQAGLPDDSPLLAGGPHTVTTLSNGRVYALAPEPGNGGEIVELTSTGIRRTGITLYDYATFQTDGSIRYDIPSGGTQTFVELPLTGFDSSGNPQYPGPMWWPTGAATILATTSATTPPIGNGSMPITSSKVVVSYDDSLDAGMHLGGVALDSSGAEDPWLWTSMPSVTTDVPPDGLGSYDIGDGVTYGGDVAMSSGRNIILGYHGEFWNGSEMSQWMHFYDDGLFVSQFGTPGSYPTPWGGATPGFAGNAFSASLIANGPDIYLWHNTESGHGGLIRWHLLGLDGIQEAVGSGPLDGTIPLSAHVPAFPTGLAANGGNGFVALTWNAAVGATSYNVEYSTTDGGPYTIISNATSATSYTVTGLTNNTAYFFAVTAQTTNGTSPASNQVRAFPFDPSIPVQPAGKIPHADDLPLTVTSASPAAGLASLSTGEPPNFYDTLCGLELDNIGAQGYCIFDFDGTGADRINVDSPFTIARGSGWADYGPGEAKAQGEDFIIDGFDGGGGGSSIPTYWIYANPIGTINVDTDSNWHYLTVLCPDQNDQAHAFTLTLTPQGQLSPAASYSVALTDPADDQVFQFLFTGNVTLTMTSTSSPTQSDALLKAIFLDGVAPPVSAAPTNLASTGGNAQVLLSWTASAGAAEYCVFRGTASGAESPAAIGASTTNSYTDRGVTNGATCYYTVAAVNASGVGGPSNEAVATPTGSAVGAPSAPTNLTATAGDGQVSLFWPASVGAAGYNVYRVTISGAEGGGGAIYAGVTSTTQVDIDLTNGTTYYYTVMAVNAYGESGFSPEAVATPEAPIGWVTGSDFAGWEDNRFAGFLGLAFTTGSSPVTVDQLGRWVSAGNSLTHIVKLTLAGNQVDVPGGSVTVTTEGQPANQFSWVSLSSPITLPANTAYYLTSQEYASSDVYWVDEETITTTDVASCTTSEVNSSSFGDGWVTGGATTWGSGPNHSFGPVSFAYSMGPPPVPSLPTNLTATAGDTLATLSWTASGTAASYNVYRGTSAGAESATAILSLPDTSCTDSGLTNGTTYYYEVTALNAGGESGFSNEATATPLPSGNLTPWVTSDTITWGADNRFGGWLGLAFTTGSSDVTITHLGRYVQAADPSAPSGSLPANSLTHTVKLTLASNEADVAGGSATVATAGVTPGLFAWGFLSTPITLPANTAYFLTSLETSGGDSTSLDKTTIATTSVATCTSSEYGPGTSFGGTWGDGVWDVGTRDTAFGPVSFIYETAPPPPPAPSNLTATASNAQILLSWTGSGLAAAYNIYRSTTSGGETGTAAIDTTTTASYSDSGLINSITYYYEVTGVDVAGESAASNEADATPQPTTRWVMSEIITWGPDNRWSGWLGLAFTTGSSDVTITQLGRYVQGASSSLAANSQTHMVKLTLAGNQVDVAGGSVTVATAALTPGQFAYEALSSPITLPANTAYFLTSLESAGGDSTSVDRTTITTTSVATCTSSEYGPPTNLPDNTWTAGNWSVGVPNTAFGPVSFTYETGPPAPTNLTATPGSGQISLSWTPAIGAASYNVYRGTASGNESTTPIYADIASTTQLDAGLTNGVTYYYTATAMNASGDSIFSNEASATPLALPTAAWITGETLGKERNDYSSFVGLAFTTAGNLVTVTQLGRWVLAGNSGSHTVKLTLASSGVDVVGGSVSVNTSGQTAGQFAFVALSSPIILPANTGYFLSSLESAGGDMWGDLNTTITTTNVATCNSAEFYSGTTWTPELYNGSANVSYGPVSFVYTLSPPATPTGLTATAGNAQVSLSWTAPIGAATYNVYRGTTAGAESANAIGTSATTTFSDSGLTDGVTYFYTVAAVNAAGTSAASKEASATPTSTPLAAWVTAATPGALRNNYSSFVGLAFTTGSSSVIATQLGRWVLSGNSAAHTVKLTLASTGVDVAGGSVTVNTSGRPAGQFAYVGLASPITLAGSTQYFLSSQETSGGDTWCDLNTTLTTTNVAACNSAEFLFGATWTPEGSSNNAYVPVSFVYQVGAPSAPTSLTATAGNAQVSLSWTAGYGATSYNVYRGTTTGAESATPIASPSAAAYMDSGLTNGATYYYTVKDVNAAGTSAASNEAIATPTSAPVTAWVSAVSPGAARNDYANFVGLALTTGASPVTVSQLGRYVLSGNSAPHTVKLSLGGNGADVAGGSVTVNTSGQTAGQFAYVGLPSPIVLTGNTTYFLSSLEVAGADTWYDLNTTLTTTNVATCNSAEFYFGTAWTPELYNGAGANAYGPVSFVYAPTLPSAPTALAATEVNGVITLTWNAVSGATTYNVYRGTSSGGEGATARATGVSAAPYADRAVANGITYYYTVVAVNAAGPSAASNECSVTPFASNAWVTAITPGAVRNNFSGFVGLAFTTASSPVTVYQLGRWVYPGNSGSHTVKLTLASTGVDVAGGSATVYTSGQSAGQFAYASLTSPITLPGDTQYFLSSQETSGGDAWYDLNTKLTTTSVAASNGAEFLNDATWTPEGTAGYSYVPVSFIY